MILLQASFDYLILYYFEFTIPHNIHEGLSFPKHSHMGYKPTSQLCQIANLSKRVNIRKVE